MQVLGEAKLTSLRHFKEQVFCMPEALCFNLLQILKFCREITHGRAHLTGFPWQVKEVEKGQECGLGLDVKFEVLPVSCA